MKRALLIIIATASAASAQTTSITVMADTNRAVRTNFTIGNAQVTGLQALLDQKLSLSGDGGSVTNLNPANLSGAVAINRGGTGATNAAGARENLQLGTAATNPASAFQPASSVLTNLAAGNGSSLTNVTVDGSTLTNVSATNLVGAVGTTNGGTGGTNAASGLANLLPSYASNASKVLAVNTNENGVEWVTASGGGSGLPETPLAISNGGSGASDVVGVLSNFNLVRGSRITIGTSVTNAGTHGIAIGSNAQAPSQDGVAIGRDTIVDTGEGVAIGYSSSVVKNNGTYSDGVAIGWDAYAESGVAIGASSKATGGGLTTDFYGVAVGYDSDADMNGIAIGYDAISTYSGIAIGENSFAQHGSVAIGGFAEAYGFSPPVTNAAQIGTGINAESHTIQFLSAGTVDTNEWARIAAISTYPTTNVSVVGTNNTNTLVFSNGILVDVQ